MMTVRSRNLLSVCGLFGGPLAWFVSTQLNYTLAGSECGTLNVTILTALALAIGAGAALFLVWFTVRSVGEARNPGLAISLVAIGAIGGLVASIVQDLLQSLVPRRS